MRRQPRALRRIAGNLTGATGDRIEAWYVAHPVQWPYRSVAELEGSITILTRALAALAPCDIHLRVSSVERPVSEWARQLSQATTNPANAKAWREHLLASQRALNSRPMSEPVVMFGVTVGKQGVIEQVKGLRKGTDAARRLHADLTALDATLGDVASPATQRELEWLARRSIGLCLPSPVPTPGTGLDPLDDDNLAALYDEVAWPPDHPFARTRKIVGYRDGEPVERHVAMLSVGRMEEQHTPERDTPWLARLTQLSGVEISVRGEVMTGEKAASRVSRKVDRLMDEQAQSDEHGLKQKAHRDRVIRQAEELADVMKYAWSDDAVTFTGQVRVAIAGDSPERALERAHKLRLHMRKQRIDMGLMRCVVPVAREFVPGERRVTTEYTRDMPVRLLAAGVPQMSGAIGDRQGARRGYVVSGSTRIPFMWDLFLAGSAGGGRSLVTPVVAEQGSGKSFLMGSTAATECLRGAWVTVVDPPGTMAAIAQWAPIRHCSAVLDVMATKFSPFALFPEVRTEDFLDHEDVIGLEGKAALRKAWELAQDAEKEAKHERAQLVLDSLLGVLPHDPGAAAERELLLAEAIHRTPRKASTTIEHVLAELAHMARTSDDKATQQLSSALERIADLPRARNWMRSGAVGSQHLTSRLLVITMDNLTLPASTDPAEWDTSQRLSVVTLALAMHYASARVYRLPRAVEKLSVFDESHLVAGWPSVRRLTEKKNRQSRKYNERVFYGSQDVDTTLTNEKIGDALVNDVIIGQLGSEDQQRKAVAMLGIHPGFASDVGGLRSGDRRHWLVRVNGQVGLVEFTLDEHPDLAELLDTRPERADQRALALVKGEGWFQ